LAESHVAKGQVEAVVVGMGLNLDWPVDLPEELSLTAASVNHLTGNSVDREEVLVAWLRHFDRHLVAIGNDAGRIKFLEGVRSASSTIGRDVRVESANESFDGRAVGIADDGRLLVDRNGSIVSVTVADIVHARLLA